MVDLSIYLKQSTLITLTNMQAFKLIKDRWKSKTPRFFKHFVAGGTAVGGFGMTCLPFLSSLPAKLQAVPGYMIAVGLATAGMAKLTKQDTESTQKVDQFISSGSTPAPSTDEPTK